MKWEMRCEGIEVNNLCVVYDMCQPMERELDACRCSYHTTAITKFWGSIWGACYIHDYEVEI